MKETSNSIEIENYLMDERKRDEPEVILQNEFINARCLKRGGGNVNRLGRVNHRLA